MSLLPPKKTKNKYIYLYEYSMWVATLYSNSNRLYKNGETNGFSPEMFTEVLDTVYVTMSI